MQERADGTVSMSAWAGCTVLRKTGLWPLFGSMSVLREIVLWPLLVGMSVWPVYGLCLLICLYGLFSGMYNFSGIA